MFALDTGYAAGFVVFRYYVARVFGENFLFVHLGEDASPTGAIIADDVLYVATAGALENSTNELAVLEGLVEVGRCADGQPLDGTISGTFEEGADMTSSVEGIATGALEGFITGDYGILQSEHGQYFVGTGSDAVPGFAFLDGSVYCIGSIQTDSSDGSLVQASEYTFSNITRMTLPESEGTRVDVCYMPR